MAKVSMSIMFQHQREKTPGMSLSRIAEKAHTRHLINQLKTGG